MILSHKTHCSACKTDRPVSAPLEIDSKESDKRSLIGDRTKDCCQGLKDKGLFNHDVSSPDYFKHPFDVLPCSVLEYILKYLKLKDFLSISLVCKRWREHSVNIILLLHLQMDSMPLFNLVPIYNEFSLINKKEVEDRFSVSLCLFFKEKINDNAIKYPELKLILMQKMINEWICNFVNENNIHTITELLPTEVEALNKKINETDKAENEKDDPGLGEQNMEVLYEMLKSGIEEFKVIDKNQKDIAAKNNGGSGTGSGPTNDSLGTSMMVGALFLMTFNVLRTIKNKK